MRDRTARALLAALAGALLLVSNQPAAAQEEAGGHPSDPWFALDHVLDVAIEMAPEDLDLLRGKWRTFAGMYGGADCRAYPFPPVYFWSAADVTVDGQRYGNVGVRKKGFRGSPGTWRPSLKIAFDKFVDGQTLGGALRRITLNNSAEDPSLLNTCLAYSVFADAGLPAPRCNYAAVTVNGEELGLYVHLEDIERSLLSRVFVDPGGDLYEGTVTDFHPGFGGAFEKKTNQENGDRSAVDAIIAALADPSPAGLEALAAVVDLDRFITFWAAELLLGHAEGYAGNHHNFHFYREPGGRVVFIPWDVDSTFNDPGIWFTWRGAIAHRLYGDAAWRAAFLRRLRELLDTVWNETELLRRSERVAAIVRAHASFEQRAGVASGADRVRRFIAERRAQLLAIAAAPPPPPSRGPFSPARCLGTPTTFELRFETTYGSNDSGDPFAAGRVTRYLLDGVDLAVGPSGATAGLAGPDEAELIELENYVIIDLMVMGPDSVIDGLSYWAQPYRFVNGARLMADRNPSGRWKRRPDGAAIKWTMRSGATEREILFPLHTSVLELDAAGTTPGDVISGRFYGTLWDVADWTANEESANDDSEIGLNYWVSGPYVRNMLDWYERVTQWPVDETKSGNLGLIINEVAARGQPRDWFELYNASGAPLALAGFLLADDLTDRTRRVPFVTDQVIEPGAYVRIELDADGWPGFALGRDEELGIWTWYHRPVAQIDWQDGDSDRGMSYARVPDVTGPFRTVTTPTPGAPNVAP